MVKHCEKHTKCHLTVHIKLVNFMQKLTKLRKELGVAHAFKPSALEAETG